MIDRVVASMTRRRRRRAAAHPECRRTLARPVVSVGNLSMGGAGKTPLVAYVARTLTEMGHKPAVLSRGYARPRPADGAVVVSDGMRVLAEYDVAGDEPLMLARQLPGCAVVVSPDRFLAGSLAERRLGCTVHILDDGFQHLQLVRALDIVIVRRRDLGDRMMPAGRLREPMEALASAGAIVVDATESIDDTVAGLSGRQPFRMSRHLGPARDEPAFAFAGIGHPEGFFDTLRRGGWSIVETMAFPDHRPYSPGDIARLRESAARAGARVLVTTEKDAVRLGESAPAPAGIPIVTVPMQVSIEPTREFAGLLEQAVGGVRA